MVLPFYHSAMASLEQVPGTHECHSTQVGKHCDENGLYVIFSTGRLHTAAHSLPFWSAAHD